MDIANQMFRDDLCQSTCDSWVPVLSAFILDLAAVNTRTILNIIKKTIMIQEGIF